MDADENDAEEGANEYEEGLRLRRLKVTSSPKWGGDHARKDSARGTSKNIF